MGANAEIYAVILMETLQYRSLYTVIYDFSNKEISVLT